VSGTYIEGGVFVARFGGGGGRRRAVWKNVWPKVRERGAVV
jgi:hypothetical protein